jgi:hypothetical protein
VGADLGHRHQAHPQSLAFDLKVPHLTSAALRRPYLPGIVFEANP